MSVFTNEIIVDGIVLVDGSATVQPISGTVSVGNFPATQNVAVTSSVEIEIKNDSGNPIPVSGTVTANAGTGTFTTNGLTDAQLRATPVPVSGTFTSGSTGTATVTSVSVTNTVATTLSASNSAKQKVVLYNEGGTLFVKLGTAASSTSYSYTLTANSTLEIPSQYYGIITARKNSGTTNVLVTEIGI